MRTATAQVDSKSSEGSVPVSTAKHSLAESDLADFCLPPVSIDWSQYMPIEDLARSAVVTVSPGESVRSVAQTMESESVGSVIVESDTKPVGIVTDRDLTTRVIANGEESTDGPVETVMTENPTTVDCETGFYTAMKQMRESGVRRLPVCENGELVGIITADDITELLADEQQQVADVLRAQRPPY